MSWISPFSLAGEWFKGNLHTHTTQSDGLLSPEEAIAWYRGHGYDFVALSDHWVLTQGQTFGPPNDFVTISGTELDGPGYHMLALGVSDLPARELADSAQALTDAIVAQGGLPFFAHPYWTGQSSADIAPIRRIAGIEVFNSVCEREVGLGYASVHWDELLALGLRLNALAVDDVHWRLDCQGMGYIMVRAKSLDESSILEAVRRGHFYSSSGPKIADLQVVRQEDGQPALRVRCSPCSTITFYASGPRGRRFEAVPGQSLDSAILPFRAEQIYLRVECRDLRGGTAWSNPIYVEDVLSGKGRVQA